MHTQSRRGALTRISVFLLSFGLFSGTAIAAIDIDQQPLLVAKPVPGNMAIIGSFEFPTMVTRAYKSGYSSGEAYVGYFDGGKCYAYSYSSLESERHFYPVNSNGPTCSGGNWSGKFLNWATMQSIDIFRHILTGGYRHKDTPTETWLEKGVQTGQGGAGNNFPDANISGSTTVFGATPFSSWDSFKTRIGVANVRMGNKLRFTAGTLSNSVVDYDPNASSFDQNKTYELSVRVKVCDDSVGLEANCKDYSQGKKPEGLIQANAEDMRFSAFGYLNDNSAGSNSRNRDGGIMHSRMKYVGPKEVTEDNVLENNARREWDPVTGVFIPNPDPSDASNTPMGSAPEVRHSGVISYINNSGMIVEGTEFKRFDNVSELYYTAYRYVKKLGNISDYTARPTGLSDNDWAKMVGGLPIITNWYPDGDDPLQFSCQKTFFLGIGDTNTHNDKKNIPGSGDDLNITDRRNKINSMEGGGVNVTGAGTGSDYIAALAYDAHTADLRTDLAGKQTISTYWIDILESGLKGRKNNPYWLAAKYGGFRVPEDYDPDTQATALPTAWWHTNGQTLSTSDLRPDNFYVVSSAQDMVDSLTQAFTDIQAEQRGNRSSLALNSTVLKEGVATFQAEYTSGSWTGNLNAFSIDEDTGEVDLTPIWTAASKLPAWDDRNIWIGTGSGEGAGMTAFTASNTGIHTGLRKLLTDAAGVSGSNDLINFFRGKRDDENSLNGFRVRQGVLGDIVNSQPIYVGVPSSTLFRNRSFAGASSYASFSGAQADRTPVVYVGSNDGMLHGFNATVGEADSGKELFAYIPYTVTKNGLGELAKRNYEHRYFVDGELTVADAYDGAKWRTILVGTLGAGGVDEDHETNNAVFALDVTDPANVSLLWEVSSAELPELGINLGKPVIAQVANGQWKALLGNGPNSSGGTASLISIDVFSGAASAYAVSADTENGLSAVRAWDSDRDAFTDTIYAGDLKGNLWKVTGIGGTPSATAIFTAAEGQPITAMPLMARSPYNQQVWLFFGTGSYLNTADLSDMTIQSWYGIKDTGTATTRADLLERKILIDQAVGNGITARVIEEGAREDLNDKDGWYIDLAVNSQGQGERMVTPNQFQGSALIGNTRIPDARDPCAPTGRGVIMAIDPFTGARLHDSYFDLDGDKQFTDSDMIQINGEWVPVSGIGLDTGFSNPSFTDDHMYIPMDDGGIRDLDINPFSEGAGRTSWRELINTGG